MEVMHYLQNNTLYCNMGFTTTHEEKISVTWDTSHVGEFLSFILNHDNPLYELSLLNYTEDNIYKALKRSNILLDVANQKIEGNDIPDPYIKDLCVSVLANEKHFGLQYDVLKRYASMYKDEADESRARRNLILSKKNFDGVDIDFEQKQNIRKITDLLLLNSIYENSDITMEERLYAFLHANNDENRHILDYTCKMSSSVSYSDIDTEIKNWIESVGFAKTSDFDNMLDLFRGKKFDLKIYESASFESFYDFILYILTYMLKNHIKLKICENCGQYFYPDKRSDAIFCNAISPQDSTKTCKEYGKYINQQSKIKDSVTLTLHKQIYNTFRNQYVRNKTDANQKKLNDFMNESDRFKNDVKHGVKTELEYMEWLEYIKEGEHNADDNKEE